MEKEKKNPKKVEMYSNQFPENGKPEGENVKKLTYEALEQLAVNLREQCKNLNQRCQIAENALNSFNEVGMLLSILEQGTYFKDAFVERCSSTIEKIINSALDATEEAERKAKEDGKVD